MAKKKPAKNRPASKKASKKGGASDKFAALKAGLKPPDEPGPKATPEQIAVYKAEDKLYRTGQKWLTIQEVKEEKRRGTDERNDRINNLEQAILGVIREDKHDKPLRELDRCRKWLVDKEKQEAERAKFVKAKSERIKALEAEFHGILFGEQQTLPGVHGATKDDAAKTVGEFVQAASDEGVTVSVNGKPINGKEVAAKLARELIDQEARIEVKIGRTMRPGVVVGLGPSDTTVSIQLDKAVKIKGTATREMAVEASRLTVIQA